MRQMPGKRISELIQRQGITQKELARRIGITKVSVSRYVNGHRIPKGHVLTAIASALCVTPEELLTDTDNREDPGPAYLRTLNTIRDESHEWTHDQKVRLIDAILESYEDKN